MINIGLGRLPPRQWPKDGRGVAKYQLKKITVEKNNNIEWLSLQIDSHFIIIILIYEHFFWYSSHWESWAFCIDAEFYAGVSPPTFPYYKHLQMFRSYFGTGIGSFRMIRLPMLQQLRIIVSWKWSQCLEFTKLMYWNISSLTWTISTDWDSLYQKSDDVCMLRHYKISWPTWN